MKRPEISYRVRKQPFTIGEARVYQQLLEIAGSDLHVFPKQMLENLIEPNVNLWERHSGSDSMQNRIKNKQVDFVIYDKEWEVLCALEFLDSDKHEKLDPIVSLSLESAGIPLIALFSYKNHSSQELASLIASEVQKVAENLQP